MKKKIHRLMAAMVLCCLFSANAEANEGNKGLNAGIAYSRWDFTYRDVYIPFFGRNEDVTGSMQLVGPRLGYSLSQENGFGLDIDLSFLQAVGQEFDRNRGDSKLPNFLRAAGNLNYTFGKYFFVSAGLNALYNVNNANGGHFGLGGTLGAGAIYDRFFAKIYKEGNSRALTFTGEGSSFSGFGASIGYLWAM